MNLENVLEIAQLSDPGMVRSHNEDSVASDALRGFAILADGMGGYSAGEVASGIAVTMLSEGLRAARAAPYLDDPAALLKAEVEKANAAIYQTAQSQPKYNGMGTTLVMAVFYDDRVIAAHVGDSRLYRLRGEDLSQVTRDHSLLQEQIDSGMITAEAARRSQNRNLVTRALGVDPTVEVEITVADARPEDVFLFCSDGLNDMVEDEDIRLALASLAVNLPLAAQQLVQMANDNGGKDNVSVILVRVVRPFPAPRGFWARLMARAMR